VAFFVLGVVAICWKRGTHTRKQRTFGMIGVGVGDPGRESQLVGCVERVKAVAEPPHSKGRAARLGRLALQERAGPPEGGRYWG